jgi:hypothetical protein
MRCLYCHEQSPRIPSIYIVLFSNARSRADSCLSIGSARIVFIALIKCIFSSIRLVGNSLVIGYCWCSRRQSIAAVIQRFLRYDTVYAGVNDTSIERSQSRARISSSNSSFKNPSRSKFLRFKVLLGSMTSSSPSYFTMNVPQSSI